MRSQNSAPEPVTIPYLLALCEQVGGQRSAARLLRVFAKPRAKPRRLP
jgi:hypothetical protein